MSLIHLGPPAAFMYQCSGTATAWFRRAPAKPEWVVYFWTLSRNVKNNTNHERVCTSCRVRSSKKNACSCWRTKPTVTNSTQLTWGVRFRSVSQKDNAYHQDYLSSFCVIIPLGDLFQDFVLGKKYVVDFSLGGKNKFNFFTNAFLLHPVYALREAYFHWRLCWARNTVLNIAGVILVYIQAVYSWDYFVFGECRLKQFIDF